jgi:alkanesulfonate monooxygenase SsuD/methylene tetrahydromethanopterin reductase-like flavin-dependent oxidoreductase (luciferase family)
MTLLAAVATVTSRARLMTSILIAPLRNAGMLAKQAATIDAISGGRLTLGMAVGGREDDYIAGAAEFRGRGKRMDRMIEHMKRVWSGELFMDGSEPVGPAPLQPRGPELLIGGSAPAAVARVGRWADGFIAGGGGNPQRARQGFELALDSWREHDRDGMPRFVTGLTFALGDDALERGRANTLRYYGWAGQETAEARARGTLGTPEAIRDTLRGLEEVGVDEVYLQATVADLDQIDRVLEAIG